MSQYANSSLRYAAQGIAFDCLTTGLLIDRTPGPHEGLPVNVSYTDFKAGNIVCPTKKCLTSGKVLAAGLVLEHLLAILVPLLFIPRFYQRTTTNRTIVKSGGHLLFGMGMLAVASFGEVAQHIHDNWLYAGLFNSFYNTMFHSALCFGQSLLTKGITGTDGAHNIRNIGYCTISTGTMIIGTVATANEKNPTLIFGLGAQQIVWPIVFGMLTLVTGSFVLHAVRSTSQVRHFIYASLTICLYIVGIIATSLIASTGSQWWHLATALSFLLGYVAQTSWLRAILAVDQSVKQS